jgi:FlaA1/EpsC-like NDP-sugar epimerase
VLGSRGSVVPTFNRQIDNGGPVTVTHEDMTRYFMSIPEAVNLIIHAACMTTGDDIFVLRMGEVVRIVELAERMIRMRGLRPNIDIPIQFTGMRPGEKMHEVLFNDHEKPVETLHPHILQITDWGDGFDVSLFLESLGRLSRSFTQEHALETLQAIIEGKESAAVQV